MAEELQFRKDFYFSETQYRLFNARHERNRFLKQGEDLHRFTECVDQHGKPFGLFDDYEFIGSGYIKDIIIK